MNIRRAGADDLSTLMDVEVACFDEVRYSKDSILLMLTDQDFITFLAERGRAIGSASVHVDGEESHLISLGVVPGHRCKGVATALLRAAREEAFLRGATYMLLQVSILNVPAMALYLRHGFQVMEVLKDYYGIGKDAYLMEGRL